jgi:hypothetical protein
MGGRQRGSEFVPQGDRQLSRFPSDRGSLSPVVLERLLPGILRLVEMSKQDGCRLKKSRLQLLVRLHSKTPNPISGMFIISANKRNAGWAS